jgi:hypothetical protein
MRKGDPLGRPFVLVEGSNHEVVIEEPRMIRLILLTPYYLLLTNSYHKVPQTHQLPVFTPGRLTFV